MATTWNVLELVLVAQQRTAVVRQSQRQDVHGVLLEDLLPEERRVLELAVGEQLHGAHVLLLAVRHAWCLCFWWIP